MDPDTNLKEQLGLSLQLIEDSNDFGGEMTKEDAQRLAELVVAMDEWLFKGGFLPSRWQQVTNPPGHQ